MANRFFEGAAHAAAYAKFRPLPPNSLVERVVNFAKEKQGTLNAAADVGCGSGQSTEILSPYFKSVTGLDVSEAQVSEAKKLNKHPNITYLVSPAETLPFGDQSLSLVTSGQACHWFDLPAFYKEVDRILVPGGVLALYGYLFPKPVYGDKTDELYEIVNHLYKETLNGYIYQGSKEVYLEQYGSPKYTMIYKDRIRDDSHYVDKIATVADLTGYISSWSGFQKFHAENGDEAARKLLNDFQNNIMKTLDVGTSPEETSICLRYHYFLLMGSKPL